MSRVIKFRAWDKQEKKMYACSGFLSGQVVIIQEDGKVLGKKDDDFELMQFIGLLDKNGCEVYEGDILQIENATAQVVFWERPPEFGLNFYHNEEKWCEDWNLTDDSDRMEIIGNIYENPEMVEEEKK